jgi:hypothetical protein
VCLFRRETFMKKGGSQANNRDAVLIDFLVAHSGLAFALEVLIEASFLVVRWETGSVRNDVPRWITREARFDRDLLRATEAIVGDHMASASATELLKCQALAAKFATHEKIELQAASATLVPSAAASGAYGLLPRHMMSQVRQTKTNTSAWCSQFMRCPC